MTSKRTNESAWDKIGGWFNSVKENIEAGFDNSRRMYEKSADYFKEGNVVSGIATGMTATAAGVGNAAFLGVPNKIGEVVADYVKTKQAESNGNSLTESMKQFAEKTKNAIERAGEPKKPAGMPSADWEKYKAMLEAQEAQKNESIKMGPNLTGNMEIGLSDKIAEQEKLAPYKEMMEKASGMSAPYKGIGGTLKDTADKTVNTLRSKLSKDDAEKLIVDAARFTDNTVDTAKGAVSGAVLGTASGVIANAASKIAGRGLSAKEVAALAAKDALSKVIPANRSEMLDERKPDGISDEKWQACTDNQKGFILEVVSPIVNGDLDKDKLTSYLNEFEALRNNKEMYTDNFRNEFINNINHNVKADDATKQAMLANVDNAVTEVLDDKTLECIGDCIDYELAEKETENQVHGNMIKSVGSAAQRVAATATAKSAADSLSNAFATAKAQTDQELRQPSGMPSADWEKYKAMLEAQKEAETPDGNVITNMAKQAVGAAKSAAEKVNERVTAAEALVEGMDGSATTDVDITDDLLD